VSAVMLSYLSYPADRWPGVRCGEPIYFEVFYTFAQSDRTEV
jgi:hypothetical protein